MFKSIIRAIVVVFAGGWGIGACIGGYCWIAYANENLDGPRWAKETALGAGCFLIGVALIWLAGRTLYPPIPRPPSPCPAQPYSPPLRHP